MEDKKEFDAAEFFKACENCKYKKDDFDATFWMALIFMLSFAFQPTNKIGCTESYLKGKVDAYENMLYKYEMTKGFDCSDR